MDVNGATQMAVMQRLLIIIGLIIAAAFYFLFMAKNAKYEGLTAQEWANDYYDVVGCVEDKASYNDNPIDCL